MGHGICTYVDQFKYKGKIHYLHLLSLNLLLVHISFQLHYFLLVCFNLLTIIMEEVDHPEGHVV
jgi:hypothetical protein